MKTTEEIATKFSTAAADLINSHSREIEKLRDENDGKIVLRFNCSLSRGSIKTRLSFGVATKDEIDAQLDGDQLPLAGLETPAPKTRRSKKSSS